MKRAIKKGDGRTITLLFFPLAFCYIHYGFYARMIFAICLKIIYSLPAFHSGVSLPGRFDFIARINIFRVSNQIIKDFIALPAVTPADQLNTGSLRSCRKLIINFCKALPVQFQALKGFLHFVHGTRCRFIVIIHALQVIKFFRKQKRIFNINVDEISITKPTKTEISVNGFIKKCIMDQLEPEPEPEK